MARPAFLLGRTLADLCRMVLALAFIIGLGLLVGSRFGNSAGACLAGIALIETACPLPTRRTPPHGASRQRPGRPAAGTGKGCGAAAGREGSRQCLIPDPGGGHAPQLGQGAAVR